MLKDTSLNCKWSYSCISGSFSTITVTFSFRRRIGYFLIQVYFPDIFVVMLSWIVFWMEIEDIGNRMSLGITCILTIMFLLGSLNGNLPKVSYPKALDWYLLMSFAFVFVALMEAVVVYVLNFSALKDKEEIKCKVCTKKKKEENTSAFYKVQAHLTWSITCTLAVQRWAKIQN